MEKFILYNDVNSNVKIDVRLDGETVWLTQKQMSELFDVEVNTINYHVKEIFNSEELYENSTIRKIGIVQLEGNREVKRNVDFYNLDMIISVGYRVNSKRAVSFRIWATNTLREFIIKGFVLDDDRLKGNSKVFGKDYFKELLDRIRSIRASERRIYQQITDIFAECSIDYDPKSQTTRNFYATVQNKFHYAIHGKTASELIYNEADKNKKNMGLTTWKNSPNGRILKSDVDVAKNYLNEKEIKQLERTVSSFFDYVEGIIERGKTFDMKEFSESVNRFLEFNEFKILDGRGSVSKKQAENKAFSEYEEFNKTQKINSDFDKIIKKIKKDEQ
ncbi:MAG: virulence RhuM family protein [Alphaproteobacteria bacterium]|jgi:hypothetical protein|nr:virulence RhuM family protein [Alphaproteobacteria bacterium]